MSLLLRILFNTMMAQAGRHWAEAGGAMCLIQEHAFLDLPIWARPDRGVVATTATSASVSCARPGAAVGAPTALLSVRLLSAVSSSGIGFVRRKY